MILEQIKNIVRESGATALSYAGKFESSLKEDLSPVTEADLLVQEFLRHRLKSLFPKYKFIGEEITCNNDIISENDHVLVIDPIDGTDSFREGLPLWGISVGLVHKLKPVLGIFYMPAVNKFFYCDENGIAYEDSRVMRHPKNYLSQNVYVTSDFHRFFDCSFSGKIRSLGSTVASICFVARGAGCGAVIRGYSWDIAAAMAILKSTGGEIFNTDGTKLDFSKLILSGERSPFLIVSPTKDFPDFARYFIKKTAL